MLPLLATATAGLSVLPWCIQGLKLEPVSPKDFPTPYTQPYSLPEEWILDASFEARKKSSKKGFDLWVANGDRNPPGDFDGMRIAFGQAFIEMFMNDRTPQKLNPVASCPWEFASPHRIKLEQHSGDLKLSTQERGGPWQECFKIEDVALPAGYSVNLDGQVPPINSLDVWHVTRELPPHQEQHASGSASSESQEALLASLQQLSHKFDSASSSGGNTAALEARLASIENRLASIDAAKGTEVRELTFVKDKLDSLQVSAHPFFVLGAWKQQAHEVGFVSVSLAAEQAEPSHWVAKSRFRRVQVRPIGPISSDAEGH